MFRLTTPQVAPDAAKRRRDSRPNSDTDSMLSESVDPRTQMLRVKRASEATQSPCPGNRSKIIGRRDAVDKKYLKRLQKYSEEFPKGSVLLFKWFEWMGIHQPATQPDISEIRRIAGRQGVWLEAENCRPN